MYVRVIPLLRLPRTLGVFDYYTDEPMNRGALVTVPFRKRTVLGIVESTSAHPTIAAERIQPITRVLSPAPLLPAAQLDTALAAAHENFCAPATMLRSIVPSIPKKRVFTIDPLPTETNHHLNDQQTEVITYNTDDALITYYATVAHDHATQGRATLIITPTIARVELIARILPNAITYHHSLTATVRRSRFFELRAASAPTVIGTRTAVFAPLPALGAIIIDAEDDDGHVQDEPNPRFDSRRVAAQLARVSGAHLIISSRMPTLGVQQRYGTGRALESHPKISPHIIDLEERRLGGDYQTVTEPAIEALRAAPSALVVHGRRAEYGSLECRDCGYVPLCPRCDVPLRQVGTILQCRHCGTETPIPGSCPRCRSVSLKGRGHGIAHVIDELHRAGIPATEYNALSDPGIQVLTAAQVTHLTDRLVDVIVLTRYESLLAIPRPDADERARRLIVTLMAHLRPNGMLLVQSSDHYRSEILNPTDARWNEQTMRARDRFGYPPAWKLIELRQRTAGPHLRSISPQSVATQLAPFAGTTCRISTPRRSRARSAVNSAGTVIMIQYRTSLPRGLRDVLMALDDHWSITLNPVEPE